MVIHVGYTVLIVEQRHFFLSLIITVYLPVSEIKLRHKHSHTVTASFPVFSKQLSDLYL